MKRNEVTMLIEPSALKDFIDIRYRANAEPPAKEVPAYRPYMFDGAVLQSDFRSRTVVAGGVAIVPIHEGIDYRPSIWSDYGYLCSSMAVRSDFNRLVNDETIDRIVFDVDSPGGLYTGTPELAKDIYNARSKKETIAICNPMAASAALWIATAASKCYCLGSGEAGSIGALMLHSDMSQYYTAAGIVNTILRSPEDKADFNSLEPLKDESRTHYQAVISTIADEFIATVAKHRGVSKKVVAENFGDGRMLSGPQAAAAGLVDGVVDSLEAVLGTRIKAAKRVKLSYRLELARRDGLKRKSNADQPAQS